jgi:hypothetical protein
MLLDRAQPTPTESLSCGRGSIPGSFPSYAFERGSPRYVVFLEALLDGLWAYERVQRQGRGNAQGPVPAA